MALTRLLLAAAAVLLLAGKMPAQAGAFDTYQLIMWQERTPVQVQGLKRLGFTGTKLRATSGIISEHDLAQHEAGGLPWYVENIATDFFAPYHRYTPGKAVTWLFDAAKARRRANPDDASVFVREPSLVDPEWLARLASRLARLVQDQARFRPLFYNLADEAGIGDLAAAWDADIGPASVAGFRTWLQTQYSSLPALNRQWGTQFARWDEVTPELTDTAVRRTDQNYSAWEDFKAWMDVSFSRAVRAGTDALHRADPDALAGLEGAQLPGWGGYDYSLLAPSVDVMEIYDIGNALELARAFNPRLIALRTSFGSGPRDRAGAWRHLLQGGRGMIVWDEADSVVRSDGSPAPRGKELASLVASIRAVAPEIMASEPVRDPVAVLISQASFRTRWILDRRPVGTAWSDRDAAREYEDNAWRASRGQALQRLAGLGIRPHLLSSASLESGALARSDVRMLILPHAIALSDAEVEAIRAFAKSGGAVLADTEAGLFDGHGRLRPSPPLTDTARVPEPMLHTGTTPTAGDLDGEAGLLAAAGVLPRAVFRAPDGSRATGLEARWFQRGETELLSLQAAVPYSAPAEIEVQLAAPASMRDLRRGGEPRAGQRFKVALDPFEPTILAFER